MVLAYAIVGHDCMILVCFDFWAFTVQATGEEEPNAQTAFQDAGMYGQSSGLQTFQCPMTMTSTVPVTMPASMALLHTLFTSLLGCRH